jgi:2-polyprenyl-6-methoxyphenol hydroxylase-like FAD-dependent oxidoreductase
MRIAIIGGGIGGLSAALQLLKAGFEVHVYEQAAAIGEIGAGIQISPNASRLLVRLGLKPAMDKVGMRPLAVHQRRWDDGRTLQRAPLSPEEVEAAFGAPYYHFHRGDLAELLGDGRARQTAAYRAQAGRSDAQGRTRRGALRERGIGRSRSAGSAGNARWRSRQAGRRPGARSLALPARECSK